MFLPVVVVTVRILMAFVLAAGALLVAQDNSPIPKQSQNGEDRAAASVLNPPGLAEARGRYDEDARTNRIKLLTPLYTNAPCAEVNLRAAALAGDGLAAFNCDGTNDAERSLWRWLAATNGWVPAQLDLAAELAKIKPVVLTFRGTNGQEFSTTMPGDQPETVEVRYREYVTNIARPGTTYLRTERQPVEEVSRNLAAAAEWRAKAKAVLPRPNPCSRNLILGVFFQVSTTGWADDFPRHCSWETGTTTCPQAGATSLVPWPAPPVRSASGPAAG